MTLQAGEKAFNGYVITERDIKNYNKTYFANENERHRYFCLMIGVGIKNERK